MTTHTLTRRDIEAVDMLLRQLSHPFYVDAVLTTERHVPNLKSMHRGHFFDAEALRFFGSRNMHLHRPGLLVETRTETPGGTSWGVWVWFVSERWGVEPSLAGAFDSLTAARRSMIRRISPLARLAARRHPQQLVGACIHCGRRDYSASLVGVCSPCYMDGKR
jgi:hypothetical protein